jgi:thiamine pyrophosphokinase
MHVLILADGDPSERAQLESAWPGWSDGVALVVAADGGARLAEPLAVTPDIWVGDADSITEVDLAALGDRGAVIERSPTDKDESDAELAILAALARGATRLTVVGALGGARLDHALANVALLWLDELRGLDVRLISETSRVRALRAPDPNGSPTTLTLEGRIGDRVTLLPWGSDATGIRTIGLRFALDDDVLRVGRSRGLSNVRTDPTAVVQAQAGRLIIVESPASLS